MAITVERPGDDTGATLVVTLTPDKSARKRSSRRLTTREKILRGKQIVMDERAICAFGHDVRMAAVLTWEEFSKNVATALEATSDEYVLIQVRCAELR